MKTYLFVNEENNIYKLLSRIAALNAVEEKNVRCLLICSPEDKDFILNFPLNYKLNLEFIDYIYKHRKANMAFLFTNILRGIKYCLKKFGSCIYMNNNLIPVRKMTIPKLMEKQGYGFHMKYFNSHEKENDKHRYSFELLYVNNKNSIFLNRIQFFLQVKNLLTSSQFTDDELEVFYKNYEFLPYKLASQSPEMIFFEKDTVISTIDFFAFDDSVEISNISDKLIHNEKPIFNINCDLSLLNPMAKNTNKQLIMKLISYDKFYANILNIATPNVKINFCIPEKNNIGIWNRKKGPQGMYHIIDYFQELYPEYTSSNTIKSDFFSVNKNAITDKPSHIWLNREIASYINVFLCNYDVSLINQLQKDGIRNEFLFYYSEHPKILDEYFNTNRKKIEEEERKVETAKLFYDKDKTYLVYNYGVLYFKDIIRLLSRTKYVYVNLKDLDANMIAACSACGCIPVLTQKTNFFHNFKENIHFLVEKIPENFDPEPMKRNLIKLYTDKISPKQSFRALVNKLFVRNIK